MADDREDGRICDDLLGVGNAYVRRRLVVKRHVLDVEAHVGQIAAQLLDGEFGCVAQTRTKDRLAAGKRALGGNLDDSAILCLREGNTERKNQECRNDENKTGTTSHCVISTLE